MRALTLRRPWSWLVATGQKRIETRTTRTSYRGPLAIHAGLNVDERAMGFLRRRLGLQVPASGGPAGAIVAVADLVDCRLLGWSEDDLRAAVSSKLSEAAVAELRTGDLIDFEGRWAWVLDNIRALTLPLPARGYQGLWMLEPEQEQLIGERLPGVDGQLDLFAVTP